MGTFDTAYKSAVKGLGKLARPSRSKYIHKRLKPPGKFDPKSFRTIPVGTRGRKAIVACRKGSYIGGRCKRGMETQAELMPKGKGMKPILGQTNYDAVEAYEGGDWAITIYKGINWAVSAMNKKTRVEKGRVFPSLEKARDYARTFRGAKRVSLPPMLMPAGAMGKCKTARVVNNPKLLVMNPKKGNKDTMKPKGVIAVYDNGGKSIDRYTVVLNERIGKDKYGAFALSHNPDSPQGFSQHIEVVMGSHLGKKIKFLSLPKNVQTHVYRRLLGTLGDWPGETKRHSKAAKQGWGVYAYRNEKGLPHSSHSKALPNYITYGTRGRIPTRPTNAMLSGVSMKLGGISGRLVVKRFPARYGTMPGKSGVYALTHNRDAWQHLVTLPEEYQHLSIGQAQKEIQDILNEVQQRYPPGYPTREKLTREFLKKALKINGGIDKRIGGNGHYGRAGKLFNKFHNGAEPRIGKLKLPDFKTLVHLGDITEIRYKPSNQSNIKGPVYRHVFHSKPKVLSSGDGTAVVLAGGCLKVKGNGIHG